METKANRTFNPDSFATVSSMFAFSPNVIYISFDAHLSLWIGIRILLRKVKQSTIFIFRLPNLVWALSAEHLSTIYL